MKNGRFLKPAAAVATLGLAFGAQAAGSLDRGVTGSAKP